MVEVGRRIKIGALCGGALLLVGTSALAEDHLVPAYTRSDGVYVASHYEPGPAPATSDVKVNLYSVRPVTRTNIYPPNHSKYNQGATSPSAPLGYDVPAQPAQRLGF